MPSAPMTSDIKFDDSSRLEVSDILRPNIAFQSLKILRTAAIRACKGSRLTQPLDVPNFRSSDAVKVAARRHQQVLGGLE